MSAPYPQDKALDDTPYAYDLAGPVLPPAYDDAGTGPTTFQTRPPPPSGPAARLPAGWSLYFDQHGAPYYHFVDPINPMITKTQWEPPTFVNPNQPPPPPQLLGDSDQPKKLFLGNKHKFGMGKKLYDDDDEIAIEMAGSQHPDAVFAAIRLAGGLHIKRNAPTSAFNMNENDIKLSKVVVDASPKAVIQHETGAQYYQSSLYQLGVFDDYRIGNTNDEFLANPRHDKTRVTCCDYPSLEKICTGETVGREFCCTFWLSFCYLSFIAMMIIGAILPTWKSNSIVNIMLLSMGGSMYVSMITWPLILYIPGCSKNQRTHLKTERRNCTSLACGNHNDQGEPYERTLTRLQVLEKIDDLTIATPKLNLIFTGFSMNKQPTKEEAIVSPSGMVRSASPKGNVGSVLDSPYDRKITFTTTVTVPIVGHVDISPPIKDVEWALATHPCSVLNLTFEADFVINPAQHQALDIIKNHMIEKYREYGEYFEIKAVKVLEPAEGFKVDDTPCQMEQIDELSHLCSRVCCWNCLIGATFWNAIASMYLCSYCWFRCISNGEYKHKTTKLLQLGAFDPTTMLPSPHASTDPASPTAPETAYSPPSPQ